jgi:formylglycine-generating enzyme required for sulfatase activity
MQFFLILGVIILFFSNCSVPNKKNVSVIRVDEVNESQYLQETFQPIKVVDGLIEMERDNTGKYIVPAMVLIEKGEFEMGDSLHIGDSSELPVHKVKIDYEFFIGKYEVTYGEYEKFAKDTKHRISSNFRGFNFPITDVSYEDAIAYTEWLSKETGDKYRLPTEAEWEYVARSGTTERFFFGNSIKDIGHYVVFGNPDSPSRVGQKLPNQWNIHDLIGNVWEWCEDWYVEDYSQAPKDGSAYSISTDSRVVRGGSWNDDKESLRVSLRTGFPQTIKMNDTGFRLVMEAN